MNKVNPTIREESKAQELSEIKARKQFEVLKNQFVALPMAIFADVRNKKLTYRDVCLYAHLLVKQGTKQSTFWGIAPLARLTGTNSTSVKESMRRLLACGHIERRPSNLTTHTICLTRLTPGGGFQGIQVKGMDVEEIEPEESGEVVRGPLREAKAARPKATKSKIAKPLSRGKDLADDRDAFFRAWDENLATVRAEDQSRQWAAIPSAKY